MKYFLSVLATSLIIVTGTNIQSESAASSLHSLVDTERAFARASHENGTQEAFLAYIANDGILFRPTAVNGKQWLLDHPSPPNAKRSLLSWQPIFADISRAGDLGYTTGPWEFKKDINDPKPAGYGNFITVWKKQMDGSWKFVIDLGISNPQPIEPAPSWQGPDDSKGQGGKAAIVDVNLERAGLIKRDWGFSSDSQAKGISKTFVSYAASDVRLFRNDSFPFVGREAVKKALAREKNVWAFQPDFCDISRSGDLGYTYGTYQFKEPDSARGVIEKGNYLRIWKQQDGQWKIVLEVTNPLPGG